MATERLSRWLHASPDLRPVRDRLERVRLLQGRYRSLAPETLASSSRVIAVDGTTVVIGADTASAAAALRALAPRLLAGLQKPRGPEEKALKNKEDQELTALRVEVQVGAPAPRRTVPPRGELPVERLAKLADGLADSPLKEALDRIVTAQRKRSTRSKR